MSACLASFCTLGCCKFSQEGWGRLMICSRSPSVIKPCFVGYLKLYQLQNPQITDYDCILVDEAQDLTPGDSTLSPFPSSYSQSFLFLWISLPVDVHFILYPRDSTIMISFHPIYAAIISIIKAQKCAKVLVGDPHQQIYGFRGATDAMALIHADHTFHLTRVSHAVH